MSDGLVYKEVVGGVELSTLSQLAMALSSELSRHFPGTNLKQITVTLATWDAVWEVYLDPKWARQRLRLERLFKLKEGKAEVSMERHKRVKQLVVFFSMAGIGTRGGWAPMQPGSHTASSEPGPSTPPPAKRSKCTKAEQAAEPTQPTKGNGRGKGKAANPSRHHSQAAMDLLDSFPSLTALTLQGLCVSSDALASLLSHPPLALQLQQLDFTDTDVPVGDEPGAVGPVFQQQRVDLAQLVALLQPLQCCDEVLVSHLHGVTAADVLALAPLCRDCTHFDLEEGSVEPSLEFWHQLVQLMPAVQEVTFNDVKGSFSAAMHESLQLMAEQPWARWLDITILMISKHLSPCK
ncbi:hypothetical protein QJQ45_006799 [Haematococcus lacustris]|nr:hypothetical protein QJQ45_006799 [Haematococcus lacustris]